MQILREHTLPHDFPVEQAHSVVSHKIWRDLFLKAFHGTWGVNVFVNFYSGTVLHGGLMIRPYLGQGSFTNSFSSNLKTLNLKMFVNHEGIYT